MAISARKYRDLFSEFTDDEKAPNVAPIPEDPELRAIDAKGFAYFMNAAHVGICKIPMNAWHQDEEIPPHEYAFGCGRSDR